MPRQNIISPRGNVVTPRGNVVSPRAASSGRLFVDGSATEDDMALIATIALDSVQTFSAIPGTYTNLLIYFVGRSDQASAQGLNLRFNGDTAANYDSQFTQIIDTAVSGTLGVVGGTSISMSRVPPSGAPAGAFSSGTISIPFYADTTHDKSVVCTWGSIESGATSGCINGIGTGSWRTANAAITSITFVVTAGALVSGSKASLYGLT